MIIAIDWDHTITNDPELFKAFIQLAIHRGHEPIIVTGRKASQPIESPLAIPVIYADDEWKRVAALKAGYKVDVWIDDSPGLIEPAKKLSWD